MGEDMHHGEEHYGRCRALPSYMRCHGDSLVRFSSQQSCGCGIVEGEACDREPQQMEEGHGAVAGAADDDSPRQRVHGVKSSPQGEYRHELHACALKVAVQFAKRDVEGQAHDDDGGDAYGQEYVSCLVGHGWLFSC